MNHYIETATGHMEIRDPFAAQNTPAPDPRITRLQQVRGILEHVIDVFEKLDQQYTAFTNLQSTAIHFAPGSLGIAVDILSNAGITSSIAVAPSVAIRVREPLHSEDLVIALIMIKLLLEGIVNDPNSGCSPLVKGLISDTVKQISTVELANDLCAQLPLKPKDNG